MPVPANEATLLPPRGHGGRVATSSLPRTGYRTSADLVASCSAQEAEETHDAARDANAAKPEEQTGRVQRNAEDGRKAHEHATEPDPPAVRPPLHVPPLRSLEEHAVTQPCERHFWPAER